MVVCCLFIIVVLYGCNAGAIPTALGATSRDLEGIGGMLVGNNIFAFDRLTEGADLNTLRGLSDLVVEGGEDGSGSSTIAMFARMGKVCCPMSDVRHYRIAPYYQCSPSK